ncbi:hypothetical protein CRYUN_Cryun13aG0066900 [Craigia yunnanensis]
MVGLQYLTGDLSGGNARCIAMLQAFQEAIKDYSTPPDKTLIRDLTSKISGFVSFLIECRPLSMSMGNVIRDGDVLLTNGSSCVVEMILLYAHELGKRFRVVVSLEFFFGASSILSNGTVYSRVGTASVAMVACAFHIPVLICCEAYKFHERVQLDSICFNELGDPDAIAKVPGRVDVNYSNNLTDKQKENLELLNSKYDATPSDYISMIVTDYGMISLPQVCLL